MSDEKRVINKYRLQPFFALSATWKNIPRVDEEIIL
jgi:hypothetical protein